MFTKILYRPALAIVISVLLLFLGVLGVKTLPVEQFPNVAPPTVQVSIAYPGASANVLVDSVLIPLEQSINGVQNMRYMVSSATSAGEAVITIYFEPGTDPNINVVNVQNRVNIMLSRLPPLVVREGILVSQVVPSMLMYVNIYSDDPNSDQKDLFNFANAYVMPELKRIKGMGLPRNLGNRAYAMRIWLNPALMNQRGISTEDVMKAVAQQSMIGSPGRLGQATGIESQSKEYVLTYVGRFNKPEQYENIILRANANGEILRLKDVCVPPKDEPPPARAAAGGHGPGDAKGPPPAAGHAGGHGAKPQEKKERRGVELGSEFFDIYSDMNGRPCASIILKQAPGSNAAEVIEEIKAKLKEIKEKRFPPGYNYELAYDVSSFLDASIEKVLHTLLEAFILVSLVVYMFLGDVRSTLIPTLAVPVSLVGTFFFLQVLGLSINLITLFAMVLAIGVVVDDAIVVVEAVHAKMAEKHLSPYRATMEVLHEISGAIIAITLVMTAVFVPVTFIPGPVGQFYRQFGITMATSIVLSGLVALTLTPVLCAMILKPHAPAHGHGHAPAAPAKKTWRGPRLVAAVVLGLGLLAGMGYLAHELWGVFGYLIVLAPLVRKPFDRAVEWVTRRYAGALGLIVTRRGLTVAVVGGFAAGIAVVNQKLPSGFIPGEDQGIIYAVLQTPSGSTLEYTNAKAQELERLIEEEFKGDVTSVTSLAGYEVLTEGRGSNAGTCLINLKTWSQRTRTARQIIAELEAKCRHMTDVKLEFFEPPAVPGFGNAGGFSVALLDQTKTSDYAALGRANEKFLAGLRKRPELQNLFTFYTADYPQYELVINNDVAMQKGVSIEKALNELNILIGSTYEQGFILFEQFYKVYVQAWPQYRRMPEDLSQLFVKSEREIEVKNEQTGKMERVRVEGEPVPFSAFMKIQKKQGLNEITRYNLYPCAVIQGAPAAGYSSGQAIKAIQEVAKQELPRGYDIDWQGLSYDESKKGNEAVYIFLIVVAFVYLVLVGQYESFILPLAIILSLPVGVFGSFFLLQAMGLANDVYAQIGLIMLVGLLGKNAILIVEFAVQRRQEGLPLRDAAIEGGKLRFRPIQMTSFAFIAGLLPLVFASGAGAIANRTIGATGTGGMLVGTVVGVLVIPGLYYLFGRIADGRKLLDDETDQPASELFSRHPLEPRREGDFVPPVGGDAPPPNPSPPPQVDGDELPVAVELPPDPPPSAPPAPGGPAH
ncbi:multidrug transporter : RND efflux system, inner membrane transporter CmeB OS=Sandaracinus amylolyticus GN=DB32_2324 PE=4 SV=1: ACR_tran: ACR_tran: ACR_tran [Gemmataceae bacterium]|nr:multidrug transporter : RND efflux system, inner membrane transporter CmeB OS=Sandaracinus amylolyticus GN=DB32_2324 PE=4 SV=1: ACR_tran: ACR_tran: ACR_tran [Gemmataceae bacterium]VTT96483.1 multidrug transporter : RND efflux system, inner membrane transporter CmeB OS=Sandaracinus amylolyticus GN=DB32_2324 PE=4 SV=1: ACR_tran: ACR_tran: ACR_tran [Gemmataceae bacterium]